MICAICLLLALTGVSPDGAGERLGPGSPMPALEIATVLAGTAPDLTAPGKTVVIELWATWSAPSRSSIPLLSQALDALAPSGVSIVAVSDEPSETVAAFIGRPEWKRQIRFAVASDPDGSTHRALLGQRLRRDIPTAVIVRDGVVQWVGHPAALRAPLEAVANGTWDVDAARAVWQAQREAVRAHGALAQEISTAVAAKEWEKAIALLDRATEEAPATARTALRLNRAQVMLMADQANDAYALIDRVVREAGVQDAALLAARTILLTPGVRDRRTDAAVGYLHALQSTAKEQSAVTCQLLAVASLQKGEESHAEQLLRRSLEIARQEARPDERFIADLEASLRRVQGRRVRNLPPDSEPDPPVQGQSAADRPGSSPPQPVP